MPNQLTSNEPDKPLFVLFLTDKDTTESGVRKKRKSGSQAPSSPAALRQEKKVKKLQHHNQHKLSKSAIELMVETDMFIKKETMLEHMRDKKFAKYINAKTLENEIIAPQKKQEYNQELMLTSEGRTMASILGKKNLGNGLCRDMLAYFEDNVTNIAVRIRRCKKKKLLSMPDVTVQNENAVSPEK